MSEAKKKTKKLAEIPPHGRVERNTKTGKYRVARYWVKDAQLTKEFLDEYGNGSFSENCAREFRFLWVAKVTAKRFSAVAGAWVEVA